MNKSIQLSILISYKAASVDPSEVARQLVQQIEKKLKDAVPAIGVAFSNMMNIDASQTESWLDPNE